MQTQENQRLRDSEAETRTWAELADAKAEQTSHKLRQATTVVSERIFFPVLNDFMTINWSHH